MEKEVKKVIIEELFSSEYMKEYIENNFDSFDAITLGSLIYNAPIELKRKKELMIMSELSMDAFYARSGYTNLDLYINLLQSEEGEYGILTKYHNGETVYSFKIQFDNYEGLQSYLDEEKERLEYDGKECWHTLDIWRKNRAGILEEVPLRYIIINGKISQVDLRLDGYLIQSPFNTGDIIKVDCRPFYDIQYFVVLRPTGLSESFPMVLYVKSEGMIDISPAEEFYSLRDFYKRCPIPALYNAELLCDKLPEDKAFLTTVKQWLKQDRVRGKLLFDFITEERREIGIKKKYVEQFLEEHA